MAFNGYTAVKTFTPPLLAPILFHDAPQLDDWPDFLMYLDSLELKVSFSTGGESKDRICTVTRKNPSGEGGEYMSCWAATLPKAVEKVQLLFTLMSDPHGPLKQIEVAIKEAETHAAAFIKENLTKLY